MATSFKEILAKAIGAQESIASAEQKAMDLQAKLDQSFADLNTARQTISTLTIERDATALRITNLDKDLSAKNQELSQSIADRDALQKRLDDPKSEGAAIAAKALRGLGVKEPVSEENPSKDSATATRDQAISEFQAEKDPLRRSAIWDKHKALILG